MQNFIVRLPCPKALKKQATNTAISKPTSERRQPVQMYLDLGQKSLGKTRLCPSCNMVYVEDDLDDAESHLQFCRKATKLPLIQPLTGHTIVNTYKDDAQTVVKVSITQLLHKTAIQEILSNALKELGSSHDLIEQSDIIYLLLGDNGSVLGCIICEKNILPNRCAFLLHQDEAVKVRIGTKRGNELNHAFDNREKTSVCSTVEDKVLKKFGSKKSKKEDGSVVISTESNILTSTSTDTGNQDNEMSPTTATATATIVNDSESLPNTTQSVVLPQKQPVQLGVKLIWVAVGTRRKGVARRLLDSARKNFVFGSVIPITSIAFSQPSEEGFAFAKAYCGGNNVLAYG